MNVVTITFVECDTQPSMGYKVLWRLFGSGDPFTDAGNFFTSPAVFYDDVNADGATYEGELIPEGTDTDCTPVLWSTPHSSEPPNPSPYSLEMDNPCMSGQISTVLTISGGTPGDVVTVQATYNGLMQLAGGIFTQAHLICFTSPGGTYDEQTSTCYHDASPHGFGLTATSVITMTGTTAAVTVEAWVDNSSDSMSSAAVGIIDVNGSTVSIFSPACKGNSGTGGDC